MESNNFWQRLKEHHRDNLKRDVYGYMLWTAFKIVVIYALILTPFILAGKYLIDFKAIFKYITDNLSDALVLVIFMLSESFLGMIPPDLFIIWSGKFNSPFLFLTLFGILSYLGGALSYLIGYGLTKTKRIKAYSERVLNKYISMVRKWGGAFIIISALFPLSPFSMVVIAVSLFKYPFRLYLLFGLSRIVRFVAQGILYLNMLNMDTLTAFLQ
ncbi:MAG: VTT domain-containing protein [Bacteroidales bacterium]|nr:VTT domain-containing protein [Bacteroidales bacterium]